MDSDTITALGGMVEELDGWADIRVVRLTGAGKVFSAGSERRLRGRWPGITVGL